MMRRGGGDGEGEEVMGRGGDGEGEVMGKGR